MGRRAWMPAAAIALALAVIAAWVSPWNPPDLAARQPTPASDERTEPSAPSLHHAAPDPEPPARSLAERANAAADERVLWIVDEDGRPVPGADVAWLATGESEPWTKGPWLRHEENVRARGHRASADDGGRVPMPDVATAFVVARDGRKYGQGLVQFTESELRHELRIADEIDLHAVVVDGLGAPVAGVPVEIAWHPTSAPWRFVGHSDANGRIAVPCVRAFPHERRSQATVALRAFVVGTDSEPVEVDRDEPPPLVRIVCPPFGYVRLRVETQGSIAAPREVALGPVAHHGSVLMMLLGELPDHLCRWVGTEEAVLGPLAIAMTWQLHPPLQAIFDGPRSQGETVVATATILNLEPCASVRLFGPDGTPVAAAAVRVGHGGFWVRRRTDENGWVHADGPEVLVPHLAAWASVEAAADGDSVRLQPLVVTRGRALDAATRAPVAAVVKPVSGLAAVGSVEAFPGCLAGDGTFEVLSRGYGTLRVLVDATGHEAPVVELAAGSTDTVVLLSRAAPPTPTK